MSHTSVAASVRKRKAEHPEDYRPVRSCLWRISCHDARSIKGGQGTAGSGPQSLQEQRSNADRMGGR